MATIDFNLAVPGDIRPALRRSAVSTLGRSITNGHLHPLRRLATALQATSFALQNAEFLAKGFEDLVIVLLEPSDKEEEMSYEAIFSSDSLYIGAVQRLDQALRFAFNGQRSVDNTIILDARPLRSQQMKKREDEKTRETNDRMAYEVFREVLSLLHPKVIVLCHCDKSGVKYGYPEALVSSLEDAGIGRYYKIGNGHDTINICSFHPMWPARTEDDEARVMRQYLFDATLIIAANALVGRTIHASDIAKLRHGARYGCLPLVPQPQDVASSALLERLRQLRLGPSREATWEKSQLDQLIRRYRVERVEAHAVHGY